MTTLALLFTWWVYELLILVGAVMLGVAIYMRKTGNG